MILFVQFDACDELNYQSSMYLTCWFMI